MLARTVVSGARPAPERVPLSLSPTPSLPALPSERPAPVRKDLVRTLSMTARPTQMAVHHSHSTPNLLVAPSPLAEMSLELAQARAALGEAHAARDVLARSLADYVGRVRQFEELARAACAERDELAVRYTQRVRRVEKARDDALCELEMLRARKGGSDGGASSTDEDELTQTIVVKSPKAVPAAMLTPVLTPVTGAMLTPTMTPVIESALPDVDEKVTFVAEFKTNAPSAAQVLVERTAILTRLPMPANVPRMDPPPLQLPARHTFAEIFGHSSGNRMTQIALSGHHVLHDVTTVWPGEENVHGWFFTPLFRCFSLAVAGTFRWVQIDAKAALDKPTECFYSMKDGNWYYAGIYKGFRMRDVPPEEWKEFPVERKNAIVAETLRERRAVAPQLQLDVRQLYDLGVLRVACVGLQCAGYNQRLCDAVYKHADKCRRAGQWKGVPFD